MHENFYGTIGSIIPTGSTFGPAPPLGAEQERVQTAPKGEQEDRVAVRRTEGRGFDRRGFECAGMEGSA